MVRQGVSGCLWRRLGAEMGSIGTFAWITSAARRDTRLPSTFRYSRGRERNRHAAESSGGSARDYSAERVSSSAFSQSRRRHRLAWLARWQLGGLLSHHPAAPARSYLSTRGTLKMKWPSLPRSKRPFNLLIGGAQVAHTLLNRRTKRAPCSDNDIRNPAAGQARPTLPSGFLTSRAVRD